jgi:hypothetical protein
MTTSEESLLCQEMPKFVDDVAGTIGYPALLLLEDLNKCLTKRDDDSTSGRDELEVQNTKLGL